MAININQQVDLLWKKVGYSVAKTDTSDIKDATNERIASLMHVRSDKIWTQSATIPTVKPTSSTPILDVGPIECISDISSTSNRTWLTGHTDWVPPVYGSTYLIRVFIDAALSTTPTTTGEQLFGAGALNDDEWFFDYEAGVLNFIGDNLPSVDFTGNHIFIDGVRYIGTKGLDQLASGSMGNITISGYTISSTGNVNLQPSAGNVINAGGTTISNVVTPASPALSDVASVEYVNNAVASLAPNKIWQADSELLITDTGIGSMTLTLDGTLVAFATSSGISVTELSVTGSISSLTDVTLSPSATRKTIIDSTTSLTLPVGTDAERPVPATAGDIRYNSTSNQVEWFNNTDWIGTASTISHQFILGDAITETYVLDQSSSSNGVLVMINGVVQSPDESYSVNNTQITFVEAPKSGDRVDIRFISNATSSLTNTSQTHIFNPTATTIGTTPTVIGSFDVILYRSAKYTVSILSPTGEGYSTDLSVVHNGSTAALSPYVSIATGIDTYIFTVAIQSGQCELSVEANSAGHSCKLHSVYITM